MCPEGPPWTYVHLIWHSCRGRRRNHTWQIVGWLDERCRSCGGRKLPFPIDKSSRRYINTGLALPRSLWKVTFEVDLYKSITPQFKVFRNVIHANQNHNYSFSLPGDKLRTAVHGSASWSVETAGASIPWFDDQTYYTSMIREMIPRSRTLYSMAAVKSKSNNYHKHAFWPRLFRCSLSSQGKHQPTCLQNWRVCSFSRSSKVKTTS